MCLGLVCRYNTLLIDKRNVLILTAMHLEAAAIARAFGEVPTRNGRHLRLASSPLPAELHIIGIGATRMPPDMSAQTVRCVIVAGIGGALDPSLKVGDVALDAESREMLAQLPLRFGRIHTADHIVATAEQKEALFRQTAAAAVDMELAVVREALKGLDVPILGIRAISDTAEQALDPAVLGLIDDIGRVRPMALFSTLLRRPMLIGQLLRMRGSAKLALGGLAQAVRTVVASMAQSSPDAGGTERFPN